MELDYLIQIFNNPEIIERATKEARQITIKAEAQFRAIKNSYNNALRTLSNTLRYSEEISR